MISRRLSNLPRRRVGRRARRELLTQARRTRHLLRGLADLELRAELHQRLRTLAEDLDASVEALLGGYA